MSKPAAWRQLINGTSIALGNHAVLLTGMSGSGKSDLALRLIDQGASLIADDVTELFVDAGRLLVRFPVDGPDTLRGRLEVRGLGLMPVRVMPSPLPLILVAELVSADEVVRLPEPAMAKYGDSDVAFVKLSAFEVSAVAKLRLAVGVAAGHIMAPL